MLIFQVIIAISLLIAVVQAVPIEYGHYPAPVIAHAPVHLAHPEPVVCNKPLKCFYLKLN